MNLYKELEVYKRAYRLSVSVYKFASTLPKEEIYGLASQLKRAVTSIPLNIAEGYGKDDSKAELRRYLKMAQGSCAELEVLTDICMDVGYMERSIHDRYEAELVAISKMLYQLIKSIK
ncbi:MAG: hypothetical protein BWY95_01525 [Bacteroidetes bacterium ADurb.BinA104]|nr:MAG: hypothetical protein BWY95_01525 [Bacteroidetes bacterium ADurb.BinA104]